jgi:hypothetical protein
MKLGLKMLGGSTILGGAEVINNGCTFLRNMILARLLSKEDFGVAATLALAVTLFELTGKMSFGQQVIQSKTGDDAGFLAGTHTCQLLTGLLDALLILVFSYPLARWFGMEAHRGALMLMACIPLCAGFASLESSRLSRHMRFAPMMITDTMPQVVITLAAWPLAVWLGDYRAILSLLLVKAGISMISSHWVGERPYRLCWNVRSIQNNLRFGWPLIVSGFLMFGVFQGDRMLVAGRYSLAELGTYAIACTIAMTPCFVVFKIAGTVTLPVLAQAQGDAQEFRARYRLFAQVMALCSAVFVVGMILGGESAIILLFGRKYAGAATLASWVMIGQAFRIVRGAPLCAAMARGDTVNTLSSNLWRLCGLALAVPVVVLKMDLHWVAIAGGAGELLALGSSLIRMERRQGIPVWDCLYPAALVAVLAGVAFGVRQLLDSASLSGKFALAVMGCAVCCLVFGLVFGKLRNAAQSLRSEALGKWRESRNVRPGSAGAV